MLNCQICVDLFIENNKTKTKTRANRAKPVSWFTCESDGFMETADNRNSCLPAWHYKHVHSWQICNRLFIESVIPEENVLMANTKAIDNCALLRQFNHLMGV